MKEKFKRTTLRNISKLPYKLICSNAFKVTANYNKRLASKTWASPDFCTVLKYNLYVYVICNNYIKI